MTTADDKKRVVHTVPTGQEPIRVDLFLSGQMEVVLSRTRIQKLIKGGEVTVNGRTVSPSYLLEGGEEVVMVVPAPEPTTLGGEDIPLQFAYEDEHLAIVDKPAGMVTHPARHAHSGTLVNALVYHFSSLPSRAGENRPGIVHRLDKDTSGLLLIAKTEEAMLKLQTALKKREIHRTYTALVCGHMKQDTGEIDLPIGRSLNDRTKMSVAGINPRGAVTRYELKDRYRSYDLLEVNLLTGRTHQIRVHFSHIGHPVFGDPEYGGREKWHQGIFAPERLLGKTLLGLLSRQALHACRLSFVHPITLEKIAVESPLPPDFKSVLEMLDRQGR